MSNRDQNPHAQPQPQARRMASTCHQHSVVEHIVEEGSRLSPLQYGRQADMSWYNIYCMDGFILLYYFTPSLVNLIKYYW